MKYPKRKTFITDLQHVLIIVALLFLIPISGMNAQQAGQQAQGQQSTQLYTQPGPGMVSVTRVLTTVNGKASWKISVCCEGRVMHMGIWDYVDKYFDDVHAAEDNGTAEVTTSATDQLTMAGGGKVYTSTMTITSIYPGRCK